MQAALTGSEAPAATAGASTVNTCTINGQPVVLERISARKSSRALALIRALTKAMPGLQTELATFRTRYERENVVELDRVQARLRYPARVLVDDDGEPVYEPAEKNGQPNPLAGEPVLVPSPVDRMSEEDWHEAGGVLRLPASPSPTETILAVFDSAMETGEDHLYRLLALFLMPNADVKRAWSAGTFKDELEARAEDLLDTAYGDELLELAVVCSELVDQQFISKARSLGGRLGNLGRLVGLDPTASPMTSPTSTDPEASTDGLSNSTPTSFTDSPAPTDGTTTAPSTPRGTSSLNSPDASAETENSNGSPPAKAGAAA